MKVPSRAALRSIGKLVRQCGAASAPVLHHPGNSHAAAEFAVAQGGRIVSGLRDEVRLMQRTSPASWGRQLQPERGFLGIGDGDEDIGVSKHFEQDRVIG